MTAAEREIVRRLREKLLEVRDHIVAVDPFVLISVDEILADSRSLEEIPANPPRDRGALIDVEILKQKLWIASCGEDLAGYIARYGDPGLSFCYGDGGTAIYKADSDRLEELEARKKWRRS